MPRAPSVRRLVRARSGVGHDTSVSQSDVAEEEKRYDDRLREWAEKRKEWVKENPKEGGRRTRKRARKNRSVRAKNRKVRGRQKTKAKRTKAKRTRAKKGGAPPGDDDPLLDMDAFSDKPLRVLEQIIDDTYELDEKGIPIGYKMPAGMDPDDLIYQQQPRKGKAAMDALHERKSMHLPPGWDCRQDGAWDEWKYYGSHVPGGRPPEEGHAVHPVLPKPWKFELDDDGGVVNIINTVDGTRNMNWQHPLDEDNDGIMPPTEDSALLFSVDDYIKWGEKKKAADELDDALHLGSGVPVERPRSPAERDVVDIGDGDGLPAFFDRPDGDDDDEDDGEDDDDGDEDDDDDDENPGADTVPGQYECDNDCGFSGSWDDVLEHERRCPNAGRDE